MGTDRLPILFAPEFRDDYKELQKRYKHIDADLAPLLRQLKAGETPGEQVPRVKYPIFKVRLPNTDARRGRSGGYRIVYYLQTPEQVIMITIYSKSDQSDIVAGTINRIIKEYEERNPPQKTKSDE